MNGPIRLLVVDDEDIPRKVACMVLSRRYQVVDVPSALAAVNLLETESFDMLLTDCEMPGMNGIQLIEICRRRWPAMPCLVASGGLNDERRRWLHDYDVPYLDKPYRMQQLLDHVECLLMPGAF